MAGHAKEFNPDMAFLQMMAICSPKETREQIEAIEMTEKEKDKVYESIKLEREAKQATQDGKEYEQSLERLADDSRDKADALDLIDLTTSEDVTEITISIKVNSFPDVEYDAENFIQDIQSFLYDVQKDEDLDIASVHCQQSSIITRTL